MPSRGDVRYQDLPADERDPCQVPGCDLPADYRSHQICRPHYAQWQNYGAIVKCKVSRQNLNTFDINKVPIKDPAHLQNLSDSDDEDFGDALRADMQDLHDDIDK